MAARSRAFLIVALLACVYVGASLAVTWLEFDNEPDIFSPPDSPTLLLDQELRQQFPRDQGLVLLFRSQDLYQPAFLHKLDELTRRLAADPRVERILGPTTLDHISGTEDGFAVDPLVDVDSLESESAAQRRARILGDRFAPGLVVSRDGSGLALVVRAKDLAGSLQRQSLYQDVLAAVDSAGLRGPLTATAGEIALDVAELNSMRRDSAVFIPITTLVGLLLVWSLFRRPLAVIVTVAAISVNVTVAVAVIALWGRPYNLVTSMVPPLAAALTTAALIHLFNALSGAAAAGLQGSARVRRAVLDIRRPALFTALTTAAGLFSLTLSPIPPIQTFGVAAGIAALLVYALTIWVVPPLLEAWDRAGWPVRGRVRAGLDRMVWGSAKAALRRPGWVIGITLAMLVAGAPLVAKVEAETDVYAFFSDDHWLIRSTQAVEDHLAGIWMLEIVFEGPARDALKDPRRLQALSRFQQWLEQLPEVDRTYGMTEIIEEMNWAFQGEEARFRRLPDDRRLISQYLFIYDGRDLYELVDRDFRQTRITANLQVHGATAIQGVVERIESRLREHPVADLKWRIAGRAKLFAEQQDWLVTGQLRSLAAALGLMFVLMFLLWRSIGAAVLCMIPNLSPILLIFIVMGASGIKLDMATAMIASVAVGIAVDDTVHVFDGFARRRARGAGLVTALMRTYSQAGRAVAATTTILCSQFLLLMFSAFIPTTQFGLLTTVGLLAALVFDLLLLPALLVTAARWMGSSPVRAR